MAGEPTDIEAVFEEVDQLLRQRGWRLDEMRMTARPNIDGGVLTQVRLRSRSEMQRTLSVPALETLFGI